MGQNLKHGLVGWYVKIQISMSKLWLLPILKWACGWWRTEGWMILLWSLRGIMSLIIHRGWISGSCAIPCMRALRKKQLLEEHSVVLVCVNTHLTVIFLPSWSASHTSISRWKAVSLNGRLAVPIVVPTLLTFFFKAIYSYGLLQLSSRIKKPFFPVHYTYSFFPFQLAC